MKRLPAVTFWRIALVVITGAGLYSILARFACGLGKTTGMSDTSPWGLWIGFDVLCGVGLAAGGFTVASMVYVFQLEKYRPILRATVLTAFLGYLMVIVSLLCDLGLPYRIWHPLVMGNLHSPLFEVAMCVMFYTTVLALEFSPALFERLGLKAPLRWIHTITLPLVILGVLLSTLHQSSLGTLFVIVPEKLHGLWYSMQLPVFFFVSAVSAGLSMVIFESYMSHRAFGTSLHHDTLQGLAKASAVVLLINLAARLVDLWARGSMSLVAEGSLESRMFLLEIVLGSVLPAALYLTPAVRRNRTGLFLSAVLALCGFVLNRLNVSITGLQRYAGRVYYPTWMEAATTIFIVAFGFAVFGAVARYLPVFPASVEPGEHGLSYAPLPARHGRTSWDRPTIATPTGFAFLSGLAMFFALAAIFVRANEAALGSRPPFHPDSARAKQVASRMAVSSMHVPAEQRFPRGTMSPGTVLFRHTTHVTGQRLACETCHAELFSMTHMASTAPAHGVATMDRCRSCHNGVSAFQIAEGCGLCHSKGTNLPLVSVTERQVSPPADFKFVSQKQSPGPVLFSHQQHVSELRGQCTGCHPAVFGMSSPDSRSLKMSLMRQGRDCGYCHNGRKAFTVTTDCRLCHGKNQSSKRQEVARANRVPPDRVLRSSRSPGAVNFGHRSHLSRGSQCSTCHPTAFRMSAASGLRMSAMKTGRQCGVCHNGRQAFTVASDCGLCHEEKHGETGKAVAPSNARLAPVDYKFPTGKDSPGPVTFSHAKHFRATRNRCDACHQNLFTMRSPEKASVTMKKMEEGRQCGACHEGKRTFKLEECARCHTM